MTTFFLILMLLDSMQFGFAAKPRLRKVQSAKGQVVSTTYAPTPTPSPNCSFDENGEPTCNPIDQADKFRR